MDFGTALCLILAALFSGIVFGRNEGFKSGYDAGERSGIRKVNDEILSHKVAGAGVDRGFGV